MESDVVKEVSKRMGKYTGKYGVHLEHVYRPWGNEQQNPKMTDLKSPRTQRSQFSVSEASSYPANDVVIIQSLVRGRQARQEVMLSDWKLCFST